MSLTITSNTLPKPPTTVSSLPPELLSHILQLAIEHASIIFFSQRHTITTLLNASQVNKQWRKESRLLLWRKVNLSSNEQVEQFLLCSERVGLNLQTRELELFEVRNLWVKEVIEGVLGLKRLKLRGEIAALNGTGDTYCKIDSKTITDLTSLTLVHVKFMAEDSPSPPPSFNLHQLEIWGPLILPLPLVSPRHFLPNPPKSKPHNRSRTSSPPPFVQISLP